MTEISRRIYHPVKLEKLPEEVREDFIEDTEPLFLGYRQAPFTTTTKLDEGKGSQIWMDVNVVFPRFVYDSTGKLVEKVTNVGYSGIDMAINSNGLLEIYNEKSYENYFNTIFPSKGVSDFFKTPLTEKQYDEELSLNKKQVEEYNDVDVNLGVNDTEDIANRLVFGKIPKNGEQKNAQNHHAVFVIPGRKKVFDVNDDFNSTETGYYDDFDHPLRRRQKALHRDVSFMEGKFKGVCGYLSDCLSELYHGYFRGNVITGYGFGEEYYSTKKNAYVKKKILLTERRFADRNQALAKFEDLITDPDFKATDLVLLNLMQKKEIQWTPELENDPNRYNSEDEVYIFDVQDISDDKNKHRIVVKKNEFERIGRNFEKHVVDPSFGFDDYFKYKKQKEEYMNSIMSSTSSQMYYKDHDTTPITLNLKEGVEKLSKNRKRKKAFLDLDE